MGSLGGRDDCKEVGLGGVSGVGDESEDEVETVESVEKTKEESVKVVTPPRKP